MTGSTADQAELLYRSALAVGNRIAVVLRDPNVRAHCVAFAASCRAAYGPAKDVARSGAKLATSVGAAWRRNV